MAYVAQMLTQEPIYKPSSIFCFKPILLSAHNLILLIYGDNRKIRNSLTIVVYLRILGISWLTNPTSPIREFFQALVVVGTQSSDF